MRGGRATCRAPEDRATRGYDVALAKGTQAGLRYLLTSDLARESSGMCHPRIEPRDTTLPWRTQAGLSDSERKGARSEGARGPGETTRRVDSLRQQERHAPVGWSQLTSTALQPRSRGHGRGMMLSTVACRCGPTSRLLTPHILRNRHKRGCLPEQRSARGLTDRDDGWVLEATFHRNGIVPLAHRLDSARHAYPVLAAHLLFDHRWCRK